MNLVTNVNVKLQIARSFQSDLDKEEY